MHAPSTSCCLKNQPGGLYPGTGWSGRYGYTAGHKGWILCNQDKTKLRHTVINEIDEIVTTVATAIEEQSASTQEISNNVNQARR